MVWTPEISQGIEVTKCRRRVVTYCKGRGLDLACGKEKVVPESIGIDIEGNAADLRIDLSDPCGLDMFSDHYFDYVFSSHVLQQLEVISVVLHRWWRIIRPGGYLILYVPDPDYYPRVGTYGGDVYNKHDLYWQDVWNVLKSFGNAKKIHASRSNDSNEYSWTLVVKKTYGFLQKARSVLRKRSTGGSICFPRQKKTDKECLTIRYGAIGDAIWLTPVFRRLKEDGYHIVHNCTEYSAQVLSGNPHIDEFMIQDDEAVPNADLSEYWKVIGKSFDKVINFSGSIEGVLLKLEGTADAKKPVKKLREKCGDIDYIDRTMEVAGYGDVKGAQPELFFSQQEEDMANLFRQSHKGKFLIVCSLSGSSLHKTYPWLHYVAGEIHAKHEDVVIVTVGDELCQFLESWQHANTINKAGVWTIRQSLIMTKYADLVIGAETGILNASSCYETPKIMFLSHSSRNNIGRYWKNCVTLHADKRNCDCYPCHKLIKSDSCPRGKHNLAAKCMENIDPHTVYAAFLKIYKEWKKKNGQSNHTKTE